jgi:hypothetical protein
MEGVVNDEGTTMSGFFDPDTGEPMRLELRSIDGTRYRMLGRIGYYSDRHEAAFLVPHDPAGFETDMASVPALCTWLVPKGGIHLPAAVLHDALVDGPGTPAGFDGPDVNRGEADRVFREAMIGLGTGTVRAWLMWTAVSLATMTRRRRYRAQMLATLTLIGLLGVLATLDLFDVWDVLPWMGRRPAGTELALGGAGAVLIPGVAALTWGRYWVAGMIAGTALALLLHVTLALAVVYSIYVVVERVVSGPAASRGDPGRVGPGRQSAERSSGSVPGR